jgi:hypothetical protein
MATRDAPVLSQRARNRALLARQLLLERKRVSLPRALERMGSLQAQYAPSMYVGLWSRVEGFSRPDLTRALERRTVVQATLQRVTIHLVSRRDYWPFALAVRTERRRWWLRQNRSSAAEQAAAAERLRAQLADGGQLKQAALAQAAGSATGAGLWVDLVRVPPSGTWERPRADLYALAEGWVGPPPPLSDDEAVQHVVRRHLGGYGPSTPKDIAGWAGLPVGRVAAALETLRLRRFRAEDGRELVDLPRLPLPDPATPAPVRFLPKWDATLLVHSRGTGILPEEYRPILFTSKNPQSLATFTVDGAVAGSWTWDGERVVPSPFERLDDTARAEVDAEAARLATLYAEVSA